MDCSPPDSSVHRILQARIMEWVVIPFSRGSSQLRDWTWVSCTVGRFFTIWATRDAPYTRYILFIKKKIQCLKNLQQLCLGKPSQTAHSITLLVQLALPHNFSSQQPYECGPPTVTSLFYLVNIVSFWLTGSWLCHMGSFRCGTWVLPWGVQASL